MEYLADIRSDTLALSAQDALLSFANHPLVHFYENRDGSDDFMPTSALKESLYMALHDFPLLLGYIRDGKDGTASVVVDRNSLNLPDFQETTSNIHFRTIKDAQYSWKTWPAQVATVGPATAPAEDGTIKLVNVNVVRLAENSGVIMFCNIPHYILDGVGFYEFLGHWAALCRYKRQASTGELPSPGKFTFDRARLAECWHDSRQSLDPLTETLLTQRSVVSRMLTLLPLTMRTRLVALSISLNYGNGYFFRVSDTALRALQSVAQEHAGSDNLSSYSLLTALFRLAMSQAYVSQSTGLVSKAMSAVSRLVSEPQTSHLLMNVVHTYKMLPPELGCYIGNNIYMCPVSTPTVSEQQGTDAEQFGRIAAQISQAVGQIDKGRVGAFCDTINANPHAYANISAAMSSQPSALTAIDERYYKTDSADFGDGSPVWISGLARHMPNFIAYFAASGSAGGTNVYASLKASVVDKMLQNKFFTAHAELI
ncbi:hypothetical protein EV183_002877 [Coemansia sp. RSA 2336]|nr:hypothetical protein EV183_002877 [Coemansia sp. RSA 2336]